MKRVLLIVLASWAVSIPWSLAHGPSSDPAGVLEVVFRALGAAVLPAAVGLGVLFYRRGTPRALHGALVGTAVVGLALFAAGLYHGVSA